jgi:Mn2+/Fe2+ NRAMP family transporter
VRPAALDDSPKEAPLFYLTFGLITGISAVLILIPGAPLIKILVVTQILNAILLLPLLIYMYGISKDERLMGEFVATRTMKTIYLVIISVVGVAISCMLWFTII